jgi:alpha-D-xyloside xylohydrolase
MADWVKLTSDLLSFSKASHDPLERVTDVECGAQGARFTLATRSGKRAFAAIDVCSEHVFRFRVAPQPLEDRRTVMVVKTDWAPVEATAADEGTRTVLRTSSLEIAMHKEPRRLTVSAGANELLQEEIDDRRSFGTSYVTFPLGFVSADDGRTHVAGAIELAPDELIYGFGEKFGPLDKRGSAVRSLNRGVGTWTEGEHKNVPFFMSSRGYGLFINTSYPALYDVGRSSNAALAFAIAHEELDVYFIHGPSYKQMLARYTEITGRPQLPPEWSFGVWMSSFAYLTRSDAEGAAVRLRQDRLPCDVLKIDTGWFHREGRGSPCDFDMQWNTETWPQPDEFLARMRDMGFKVALFVDPHVLAESPMAQEARELGYLVRMPDGSERRWELGPGCPAVAFDLTSEDSRQWYKGKLKALLAQGASTFFADWGIDSPVECRYANMDGLAHNNVYGLLYNKTVHEAIAEHTGGPAVHWGISGYAGSQRYPTTYGGDSRCTFRDMASVLRGGLSSAMSGILFYGCDIGGYGHARRPSPDETLYIRYLQHGMFLPFAQFHGMGRREPWHFGPRAVEAYRKYAGLRYRLLPYIMTQAYLTCRDGVPMLRPMALEFPDDPNAAHLDLQYMFGESLLVAPVFGPQTSRPVYLPHGEWFDYWTAQPLAGGRWITAQAPLDVLPLYVRAGSIIPMGPDMQFVAPSQRPLTLEVFGKAQPFTSSVYRNGRLCDVAVRVEAGELVVDTSALGACEVKVRAQFR